MEMNKLQTEITKTVSLIHKNTLLEWYTEKSSIN